MQKPLQAQDTINELNARDFEYMKEHIARLENKVNRLVEERDKAMIWGVLSLGTVIMALVALIASYLLKGVK